MHGTSHNLGIDVHDVSPSHAPVAVGMVFTIEPGIYIPEENLGVRLENDYLIGENGNTDLMATIPIEPDEIESLMADLETFIHADPPFEGDPLVRMALIHHQFESIHPFYDGNGRTGRILNVLYLVKEGLLDLPVLYLSRHIVRTKTDYYRHLQAVREQDAWEDWVLYMLAAVEHTARDTTRTVGRIRDAFLDAKRSIRDRFKFYSLDLINNLFTHPYTKIGFLQQDLGVTRVTATRYLDQLAADGFLEKRKIGRTNYYLNQPLIQILAGESSRP
jgi:Fic family protein